MIHRDAIFLEISAERARQEQLKAQGRFEFTCADPESSDWYALAVLTEEVGEAARAVLGKHGKVRDGGNLRNELIQIAAVAVAWIEGLDRQDGAISKAWLIEIYDGYCPDCLAVNSMRSVRADALVQHVKCALCGSMFNLLSGKGAERIGTESPSIEGQS